MTKKVVVGAGSSELYILITCAARCVTNQTGTVPEPLGIFGPKLIQLLSVPHLAYLQNFIEDRRAVPKIFTIH